MMMLADAAEKLIDALADVGVIASTDPPALNPPCAWIAGRRLGERTLAGGYKITLDCYLIARDTGIPESIRVLDSMLIDALDAADSHDFDLDSSSLGESVALPNGGAPLPAYRLTFVIDPDC